MYTQTQALTKEISEDLTIEISAKQKNSSSSDFACVHALRPALHHSTRLEFCRKYSVFMFDKTNPNLIQSLIQIY